MTSDIRTRIGSLNDQIGNAFKRGDAAALATFIRQGPSSFQQTAS